MQPIERILEGPRDGPLVHRAAPEHPVGAVAGFAAAAYFGFPLPYQFVSILGLGGVGLLLDYVVSTGYRSALSRGTSIPWYAGGNSRWGDSGSSGGFGGFGGFGIQGPGGTPIGLPFAGTSGGAYSGGAGSVLCAHPKSTVSNWCHNFVYFDSEN